MYSFKPLSLFKTYSIIFIIHFLPILYNSRQSSLQHIPPHPQHIRKFKRQLSIYSVIPQQFFSLCLFTILGNKLFSIVETKNPAFSMLSSVKCRNSQEINDFSTLSDTPFYPLFQSRKYLQCCFHSNPEEYRKSTVRPDNC